MGSDEDGARPGSACGGPAGCRAISCFQVLTGLSTVELNGLAGTCGQLVSDGQRWHVLADDGRSLSIKPANLRVTARSPAAGRSGVGAQAEPTWLRDGRAALLDEFVPEPATGPQAGATGRQVCEQLRAAMDGAMDGAPHRGGYCLVYPDGPEAQRAVGPAAVQLFSRVRGAMRRACERLFGLEERLWVGGTLLSRIESPAPCDGRDTAPSHSYSGLHVDRFNRAHYHYSALLYLSESGLDFADGAFEFVDDARLQPGLEELASQLYGSPQAEAIPAELRTPVLPRRGRLLLFEAGESNPHFVAPVREGRRHLYSVRGARRR